jgi:hypothetical protein
MRKLFTKKKVNPRDKRINLNKKTTHKTTFKMVNLAIKRIYLIKTPYGRMAKTKL